MTAAPTPKRSESSFLLAWQAAQLDFIPKSYFKLKLNHKINFKPSLGLTFSNNNCNSDSNSRMSPTRSNNSSSSDSSSGNKSASSNSSVDDLNVPPAPPNVDGLVALGQQLLSSSDSPGLPGGSMSDEEAAAVASVPVLSAAEVSWDTQGPSPWVWPEATGSTHQSSSGSSPATTTTPTANTTTNTTTTTTSFSPKTSSKTN